MGKKPPITNGNIENNNELKVKTLQTDEKSFKENGSEFKYSSISNNKYFNNLFFNFR